MIKSMTGHGRGEWGGEGKQVEVEIRSFNHRYCDIAPHLPRRLNLLEPQIRKFIKERISRGRIEVSVQIDRSSFEEQKLELDRTLAKDYHQALKALQAEFGIPGEIRLETLANFREIFARREVEIVLEIEWASLQIALEKALMELEHMREQEGYSLREDFLSRLEIVKKNLNQIVQFRLVVAKNVEMRYDAHQD